MAGMERTVVSPEETVVLVDNRNTYGIGGRSVCVGKVFYVRKGVGSVKKAKNGNRIFDCVDFGIGICCILFGQCCGKSEESRKREQCFQIALEKGAF